MDDPKKPDEEIGSSRWSIGSENFKGALIVLGIVALMVIGHYNIELFPRPEHPEDRKDGVDGGGEGKAAFEVRNAGDEWKLFRHRNPHFRFLFPKAWEVKVPKGENVRALVASGEGVPPSNCNVVAVEVPPMASTDEVVKEFEGLTGKDFLPVQKFPDAVVVEESDTYVDNHPAKLLVYSWTYSTAMLENLPYQALVISTIKPPYLYTISCGVSPRSAFEDELPKYLHVVSSFVFEDFNSRPEVPRAPLSRPAGKDDSQPPADIITVATVQESGGLTEAQLTPELAREFEKWVVETTRRKTIEAYRDQGGSNVDQFHPKLVSSSGVVEVKGRHLMVVQVSISADSESPSQVTKAVRVFGLTQKGLVAVGCVRQGSHEIAIWTGPCGEKIKEELGVSLLGEVKK